jgi:hypothetical protein
MIDRLRAHIKTANHAVSITVKEGRIHLFKYNEKTCDFAVFDECEEWAATDFILEPLPTVYYEVTVRNE